MSSHTSASSSEHKKHACDVNNISIAVVTVSDTRTTDTDINGQYLKEQITTAGHTVADYFIIADECDLVDEVIERLANDKVNVIVLNGGTGISKRDRTFDVVSKKLNKVLSGFGEIFRYLSYKEIGSSAILSRATAGIYKDTLIFSVPGSPNAVKLAWEKLIQPEIKHLVWEMNK
ncbi:MAG: molybdenum cofactor biosynthesis protein B [Lysobacterales bacterium]|jgi:molybdenum cofactor biosynthesis protein B